MDSKVYITSTAMVVSFLLYMRFGSLAFWVIGVTGFMSAWLIMLIETFLHIILSEDKFQNYRRIKKKFIKVPFFDVDNSDICSKHKISETDFFLIMLLVFIGASCLIYIII